MLDSGQGDPGGVNGGGVPIIVDGERGGVPSIVDGVSGTIDGESGGGGVPIGVCGDPDGVVMPQVVAGERGLQNPQTTSYRVQAIQTA